MPCDRVDLGGGNHAIVCGPKARALKCYVCGAPAPYLCDFRLSSPHQITHVKTCDRPMCDRHRMNVAANVDYCVEHGEREAISVDGAASGQGGLFPKDAA